MDSQKLKIFRQFNEFKIITKKRKKLKDFEEYIEKFQKFKNRIEISKINIIELKIIKGSEN